MSRRAKIWIWVAVLVCLVLVVCYVWRGTMTVKGSSKPLTRSLGEVAAVDDAIDGGQTGDVKAVEESVRWMELPASSSSEDDRRVITHMAQMEGRFQRNYTILYDDDLYAALWVAYPLCASHTSSGREETWGYDPHVPRESQTSVKAGYGASEPTVNYPKNFYARGHQIPNADRSAVPEMQAQTYYSTNMTPQLQNGFNGNIWAKLEEAVRMEIPEGDTLYVVTGAVFEKHGTDEDVKTILNKNDSKTLPVPNYYWKALLKVQRTDGEVTGASTIGFWLPHADLKGHSYADYAVSVDQIEEWTGFDMFPSLKDTLETSSEAVTSWNDFRMFMK